MDETRASQVLEALQAPPAAEAPLATDVPTAPNAPDALDAANVPDVADAPDAPAVADPATAGSVAKCCCGGPRHKHTPRSDEMRRDLERRLNRVIGQLGGVKAMIDDNRYCGDVLTQLAAAQSALSSVSRIVLQNHLETCVVERVQQGDMQVVEELMGLIKKFS